MLNGGVILLFVSVLSVGLTLIGGNGDFEVIKDFKDFRVIAIWNESKKKVPFLGIAGGGVAAVILHQ